MVKKKPKRPKFKPYASTTDSHDKGGHAYRRATPVGEAVTLYVSALTVCVLRGEIVDAGLSAAVFSGLPGKHLALGSWVLGRVRSRVQFARAFLNEHDVVCETCPVTPEYLPEIFPEKTLRDFIKEKTVTKPTAP